MTPYPLFLSVVIVVRNQSASVESYLAQLSAVVSGLATDYELVIVDNASEDDTVVQLLRLTAEGGMPNLQVFALIKQVDRDTAAWAGIESALGDFVASVDPTTDDFDFLGAMMREAVGGADVVFARNETKPPRTFMYSVAAATFNRLYKLLNDVHLDKDAPEYRVLSRRVVNVILQHPQPANSYRHLPATAGFARANLSYKSKAHASEPRRLRDSIDRGMFLLVSTTRAPMRIVTALSFFGAVANLIYSAYVIAIAAVKNDVAPGWVTLSLQQSGMFFLFSVVLMVLGEYILHMANLSNEGPPYHVGREFTSARMQHREKLNVEVVSSGGRHSPTA